MRLFLLTANAPSRRRAAVHAVLYETISGFLDAEQQVVLQMLPTAGVEPTDDERDALAELGGRGLEVLPTLPVPKPPEVTERARANAKRARILLAPRLQDFYPALSLRAETARRLASARADVAFVFWSPEALAAAAGNGVVPTTAYYGVPDPLPLAARLAAPDVFGIPHTSLRARVLLRERRALNARLARLHFGLMRRVEVVADICLAHVRLYAANGQPDARYVPNMYPDRGSGSAVATPEDGKLIASIGDAAATGNALGLYYLAAEVLPSLRTACGDGFSLHVCGNGAPPGPVEALLEQPEFRRRGWVSDIDAEISSAAAFLLMNNAGPYQGAYTRVLHAWSLEACVVAHARLAEAMPEVHDGENALLGRSPEEIANCVRRAIEDPKLRRRLGRAGRETYRRHFTPAAVVPQLLDAAGDAVAQANRGHASRR
jgi:Glycosyl transferases group 1